MRPTGLRLSSSRSLAKGSTIIQVPSGVERLAHMRGRADRIAHVVQAVEEGDEVVGAGKVLGRRHLEAGVAGTPASFAASRARSIDGAW